MRLPSDRRADHVIAQTRLARQHITRPLKDTVAGLVQRLVAVQAQDFAGAKWGLGLRLAGVNDREVERAFNAGEILRTHLLRPTWHFVTPADIRARTARRSWGLTSSPRSRARSELRRHE